jgi:DNA-binding PadR family transcriptional regulator
MKKLTTTSYAILGLLALRPWSAYELSKQMRRSMGAVWPRAERGIYDEPKTLVAHGFASGTEERRGLRGRTVYTITPAGRRALRAWLSEPSAPPQFESEALLRLAFLEHGTKQQALDTLAGLRAQAEEARRRVADIARDYVEGRGPYPERVHVISLITRFGADYLSLLDTWAEWAAERIEDWDGATPTSVDPDAIAILAEVAALRPVGSARTGPRQGV